MDALCDEQPNFSDINADMSIPCNTRKAQTQEPAQRHTSSPPVLIISCLTRYTQLRQEREFWSFRSNDDNMNNASPFEDMIYDEQNRHIYDQPQQHRPWLYIRFRGSSAHGERSALVTW